MLLRNDPPILQCRICFVTFSALPDIISEKEVERYHEDRYVKTFNKCQQYGSTVLYAQFSLKNIFCREVQAIGIISGSAGVHMITQSDADTKMKSDVRHHKIFQLLIEEFVTCILYSEAIEEGDK
jgi:hypothetical protein